MMNKKSKTICWILSLMIGAGIIGTIVTFPEIKEAGVPDSIVTDLDGNEIKDPVDITKTEGLIFATTTYNATASEFGSVTVTATVLPETTIDKRVDWSLAWANPSSTWAKGKEVGDYISLDSMDNSVTATCLAPFGEQIVLKATLKADETLSDSMTLDFYKRVEGVTLNLDAGDGKTSTIQSGAGIQTWNWKITQSSYPGYGSFALVSALQGTCTSSINYGVGTKNDSVATTTISYRHSQSYVQGTAFGNKFSKSWFSSGNGIGLQDLFATGGLYSSKTVSGFNGQKCIDLDFLNELRTTFNSTAIDYDFKVDLTMASGKTYSYTISVDVETGLGLPNSIVLDKDSYIF